MSRSSLTRFMFAFCFLFVMTSEAFCQRGVGSPGGVLAFVRQPGVQKEIGIENDAAKIAELRKVGDALAADIKQAFMKATPEERAMMPDIIEKLRSKYDPEVQKLLTPEQLTRVKQIDWQSRGVSAVVDKELAKAIGIPEEQRQKSLTLFREFAQAQKKIFDEANSKDIPQEVTRKQLDDLIAGYQKSADAQLTMNQKEKLKELLGKPFDFKSPTNSGKN